MVAVPRDVRQGWVKFVRVDHTQGGAGFNGTTQCNVANAGTRPASLQSAGTVTRCVTCSGVSRASRSLRVCRYTVRGPFSGPDSAAGGRPCPSALAVCSPLRVRAPDSQSRAMAAVARLRSPGGVAEWSKALVLKTSEPRGSVGSNPTPTAIHPNRINGLCGFVSYDPTFHPTFRSGYPRRADK